MTITHIERYDGPSFMAWHVNEFLTVRGTLLEIVVEEGSTHVNHDLLPRNWVTG